MRAWLQSVPLALNSKYSLAEHRLTKAVAEPLESRTLLASVAGYVYLDADGVHGTVEGNLSGFNVNLTGFDDGTRTTFTDADGRYHFDGIPVGMALSVMIGEHFGYNLTTDPGATIYFVSDGDFTGPDIGLSPETTASGVVSFDRDGTGTFSPGDRGAGNVTLFGDTNHNGLLDPGEPVAVSNADGSFQIGNLLSSGGGAVDIRAIGPAGWQPTTPGGDLVTVPAGSDSPNLSFSLSPAALGSVGGTAFFDANQNGVPEESGVSGLTVMLVTPTGDSPTTTTDGSGGYYFGGLTPRTYSISITRPDGWGLTTTNPLSATVTASQTSVSGLDFGVYQLPPPPPPPITASVSGTIFFDRNVNGTLDTDEPMVFGASVTLTVLSGPDAGQTFFRNAPYGQYNFDMLSVGDSVQITSSAVFGACPSLGSGSAYVYELSESTLNVSGIDIGWTRGVIGGVAVDGNTGEPVPGLSITLTDAATGYLVGITTLDETGHFRFTDLDALTSYRVIAATAGHHNTELVTLRPADDATNQVSTTLLAYSDSQQVAGTVFENVDGDGSQGTGEEGQGAWDVFADENNNGVHDDFEFLTTTNAAGAYTLTRVAASPNLHIRAVPPTGWREPAAQIPVLSTGSSGTSEVDFAARRQQIVSAEIADFNYTWNFVHATVDSDDAEVNVFEMYDETTGQKHGTVTVTPTWNDLSTPTNLRRWALYDGLTTVSEGCLSDCEMINISAQASGQRTFTLKTWLDTTANTTPDEDEETVVTSVYLVGFQMDLNETSSLSDDAVMMSTPSYGPDIPANFPSIVGKVSLLNGSHLPEDISTTLAAPTDVMALAEPGEVVPSPTAQLITSIKNSGEPTYFNIFGLQVSARLGDDWIRLTVNLPGQAGGILTAKEAMTVFWFQGNITAAAGGHYKVEDLGAKKQLIVNRTVDANADVVSFSASATIIPEGVDTLLTGINSIKVGIVQNIVNSTRSFTYSSPDATNILNNGSAMVPSEITYTSSVSNLTDSLNAKSAPLYAHPDAQVDIIPESDRLFQNSQASVSRDAQNLNIATSCDNPKDGGSVLQTDDDVTDSSGIILGNATYNLSQFSIDDEFATYCVIYDTYLNARKILAPLRQTRWHLFVSSDDPGASQVVVGANGGSPVTRNPVLAGQTFNQYLRSPSYSRNESDTDVQVEYHKPN